MFTIFEVADEFLTIASMSQKKLQKLCYYAQGLYGALTGEKLFNEELKVPITIASSPLTSVAEGTSIMLENLNLLEK